MPRTQERRQERPPLDDEFAVLEAAFKSGDPERLRLAVQHADSREVQERLSPVELAELNGLISEAGKRLFMGGRA